MFRIKIKFPFKRIKFYLLGIVIFSIIILLLLNFTGILKIGKLSKKSPIKSLISSAAEKTENLFKTIKKYQNDREKKKEKERKNRIFIMENELKKKEKRLQDLEENLKREKEIIDREKRRIKEQQKDIEQKEKVLIEKEKRKQAKVSIKPTEKKNVEEIERLAGVYEKMAPAAVAKIMENLNDELILEIFLQMKEKNVGRILAALKPEKAAILSKKLTERR